MIGYIKNWFVKNRALLITFCVVSVVTFITTIMTFKSILSNLDDLEHYAQTQVISDKLQNVALLGIFDIALFCFWMCLLLLIVWKVIFPNSNTVKNAFYAKELNFLVDLPSNLRREIDRK